MRVVDVSSTYKDSEESHALFDSVSAAAVWFAHEVRRNLPADMDPEAAFDAVAAQVALLFARWDDVTGNDPEEVDGGDGRCRYGLELREVMDRAEAAAGAKEIDEAAGFVSKTKRGAKK